MKTKLKPKEELFCRLVATGCSPTEAAARSGYAKAKKAADKLLSRRDIQNCIDHFRQKQKLCDAKAGYARLAYGSIADAVRLLYSEELPENIDELDLYAISEIKRSKNGVEIKFHDRIKALDRLSDLSAPESDKAEPFYKALELGAMRLYQDAHACRFS